jgi:hypothetical protein
MDKAEEQNDVSMLDGIDDIVNTNNDEFDMYNDEESNEDNNNNAHDNNNEVVVVNEETWEEGEEGNNDEIAEMDSLEKPHEEEQEETISANKNNNDKPKTLQELFALAGQTLQLVTSEDGTPLHYLGNDGKVVPISLDKSKEDEGNKTNEIETKQNNKYEERRLEAKRELQSLIGNKYQVIAGKAKNADRMEWEVVEHNIPKIQYKTRKHSKLGNKDKQWIDYLNNCDNPAAELFLFMHYGGKGGWCNHWMKLNKNEQYTTMKSNQQKAGRFHSLQ